jgi:hypothetical protein
MVVEEVTTCSADTAIKLLLNMGDIPESRTLLMVSDLHVYLLFIILFRRRILLYLYSFEIRFELRPTTS